MLEIWQIEIRSFAAMLVEHKLAPRYPYGGVCNETELGNFTCKIFSDAKRERERSFTFSPTDIPTRQFVFLLVPVPWSRVGMVINPGIPHELGATINIQ